MRRPWLFILASTLLFSSHHTSYTSTHAQTPLAAFTPTPVFGAQSVFIPSQKLYIHGGTTGVNPLPIAQTFYIDLSKKWPASQPIYGKLPDGTAAMGTTTALSNSNTAWYSFYLTVPYRFNIHSNDWENLGKMEGFNNGKEDLPAIADPTTNQINILNGFINDASAVSASIRLDTSTNISTIATGIIDLAGGFTATWSTLNKSAIVFGGYTLTSATGTKTAQKSLYAYNPSTPSGSKLTLLSVTGDGPSARYYHCMVEAYNGTKMVLFGGIDLSGRSLDDIYILDVATAKWTPGTAGGASAARRYASCAVTNDNFVVWGGAASSTAVNQNVTLVYNLITNQWVDEYSPDPYVPPPPPSVTINPSSGNGGPVPTGPDGLPLDKSTSSSSMPLTTIAAIVGGVLAFLVVVAVAVGIYCCRRRRQRREIAATTKGRDLSIGEKRGSSAATAAAAAAASAGGGGGGGNKTSVIGPRGRDSESAPRPLIRGPSNLYSTRSSSDAPQPLYSMKPVPGPRYPGPGAGYGAGSATGSDSVSGTSTFGTYLRPAHPRYSVASTVSVAVGMPLEQAGQVEEAASASAAIISSYSSPRTPIRPGRSPGSGSVSAFGNANAGTPSGSLHNDGDWSPTYSNGRPSERTVVGGGSGGGSHGVGGGGSTSSRSRQLSQAGTPPRAHTGRSSEADSQDYSYL